MKTGILHTAKLRDGIKATVCAKTFSTFHEQTEKSAEGGGGCVSKIHHRGKKNFPGATGEKLTSSGECRGRPRRPVQKRRPCLQRLPAGPAPRSGRQPDQRLTTTLGLQCPTPLLRHTSRPSSPGKRAPGLRQESRLAAGASPGQLQPFPQGPAGPGCTTTLRSATTSSPAAPVLKLVPDN